MAHGRILIGVVAMVGALCAQVLCAQQEQQGQATVQAPAQAPPTTRLLRTVDFDRYTATLGVTSAVQVATRLNESLGRLVGERNLTVQGAVSNRGLILIIRGGAGEVATAVTSVEELQKPEPLHARLQCSLLTMPLATAKELGLKAGEVTASDEAANVRVVRAAVKAKGSLRNLPEMAIEPLSTFVVATEDKSTSTPTILELSGEMVPTAADEIGITMELLRKAPPKEKEGAPERRELGKPVFRFGAGKSVMAMAVDGDTAVVLQVRCVELAGKPLVVPGDH